MNIITITKQDDGQFAISVEERHVITVRTVEQVELAVAAINGYRRAVEAITGR